VILNVALWVGGLGLLALGIVMIRDPLARLRALQVTEANLRRYDDWRGSRLVDDGTRTGADEMKDHLRSRVRLWGIVIAAGIVLLVVGFVAR
jgi:hypothetical protein